ncbi:hypothetical protein ACC718_38170, partial [Rhizobium ruizarguesonis]
GGGKKACLADIRFIGSGACLADFVVDAGKLGLPFGNALLPSLIRLFQRLVGAQLPYADQPLDNPDPIVSLCDHPADAAIQRDGCRKPHPETAETR